MATSVRPLHKRVGQQLRSLRGEHDLTQEMLAARLSVEWKPTSDSTVSNWESGTTPLPLTALEPIAKAFRMDVGHLGRRLGLCGMEPREVFIAEGQDILQAVADETPEVQAGILAMFRQAIEIARTAREARSN